MYLYQYLSLWDVSYISGNGLMSTSQCKFNRANPFSRSWDISRWSFYSYWCPDISVVCCRFCTSHICGIALIWGFPVQLSLWKSVHWLWRYKLNKVCDNRRWGIERNCLDSLSTNLWSNQVHLLGHSQNLIELF